MQEGEEGRFPLLPEEGVEEGEHGAEAARVLSCRCEDEMGRSR